MNDEGQLKGKKVMRFDVRKLGCKSKD